MTNEGLKIGALVLGIVLVILIIVLIVRGHKDKYNPCGPRRKWNSSTNKCDCAIGFTGDADCGCTVRPQDSTRYKRPNKLHDEKQGGESGCNVMLVCPWGQDTNIELVKCEYGGTCDWSKSTNHADGSGQCLICGAEGGFGPQCEFTVTSNTGTEDVWVQQNNCVMEAGDITVTGASNYSQREGSYADNGSGQVYIGPKKVPGC